MTKTFNKDLVHLISINANGLGSINKQDRFREWIKQQKAHIKLTLLLILRNNLINLLKIGIYIILMDLVPVRVCQF